MVGRLVVATALAVIVGSGPTPATRPAPVAAATAQTIEDQILGWLNNDRVARGLVPLRLDSRLRDLAEYRAGVMASTGILSHTIAGCLSCQLTARAIQWFSEGEVIAWTSYSWGDPAAAWIYNFWMTSAPHRSLLMSSTFNYVGIGIAYRSANKTTWASMVFTESVDHTRPWAKNVSHSRTGSTVYWSWTGADTRLQTHTAGLKNFDVEYRVDSGSWTVILWGTTAKSLTLTSRPSGHYYGLRVRARDNRGYLSGWTTEIRIWVP